MKTRLVRIGNSQGIRIPKSLIEKIGLHDEVEISVEDAALVIRPAAAKAREGWDRSLKEMARRGDDSLLDGDAPLTTSWDEGEWEW